MQETILKRMPRYEINGLIERDCPICGVAKDLICYTDKLTGNSEMGCRPCLEETLGIKIVKGNKPLKRL